MKLVALQFCTNLGFCLITTCNNDRCNRAYTICIQILMFENEMLSTYQYSIYRAASDNERVLRNSSVNVRQSLIMSKLKLLSSYNPAVESAVEINRHKRNHVPDEVPEQIYHLSG